jgi:quercetin dioxygenase-like cupin family protein
LNFVLKFTKSDTEATLAVVEAVIGPGRLVPPHRHGREDEYVFVIEGTVGVRVGAAEFTAPQGSYVAMPRDIPHALWNANADPARVQVTIVPGGFEQYFVELEAILKDPVLNGTEGAREELAARYDQPLVKEWIPELKAKYQLLLPGELP